MKQVFLTLTLSAVLAIGVAFAQSSGRGQDGSAGAGQSAPGGSQNAGSQAGS
jgi:hypothetical protein